MKRVKEQFKYLALLAICLLSGCSDFLDMRDLRVVGGLGKFIDLLSEIMGEEAPDLDVKDLAKLNVLSFRKPVCLWDENDSPAGNGRFQAYREIAHRFRKKLSV